VDGHSTPDVMNIKEFQKNDAVETVEDALKGGKQHHLGEGDLAEQRTHSD
jgi:hypothetical protein